MPAVLRMRLPRGVRHICWWDVCSKCEVTLPERVPLALLTPVQRSHVNGYFECTCYHPLCLFNQFGDLERTMLRRGNHASAKFWRRVLLPVIERYRDRDIPKFFRGDSAFALPKLFALLEREGFRYAIRLKSNAVLERKITPG